MSKLPDFTCKVFKDLNTMYASKPEDKNKTNILGYGLGGAGKTTLWTTAPKPIVAHSFDPDGLDSVRPQIEAGGIYTDTTFESSPSVKENAEKFHLWEQTMDKYIDNGFFNDVGTYVIDSGTMLARAIMTSILHRRKRSEGLAQIQDWGFQMELLFTWVHRLCGLPCNFILLGHIKREKDEISGRMYNSILLTGTLKETVPILFSEHYLVHSRRTSKGVERSLMTADDSEHRAKTRIGGHGVFELFEKPDIKYLLEKAGKPFEDKPY